MLSLLFIGFTEIMVVMVIVLVFFGPSKIPEIARGLGEGIRYLRESTDSIKTEIMKEVDQDGSIQDIQKEINGFKEDIQDVKGSFSRDFTPIKKEDNKNNTMGEEAENSTFQRVKMDIEEAKIAHHKGTICEDELVSDNPDTAIKNPSIEETISEENQEKELSPTEDKPINKEAEKVIKKEIKEAVNEHQIPGTVSRDY